MQVQYPMQGVLDIHQYQQKSSNATVTITVSNVPTTQTIDHAAGTIFNSTVDGVNYQFVTIADTTQILRVVYSRFQMSGFMKEPE